MRREDIYTSAQELPPNVEKRLERDFSVIQTDELVVAKHRNGRYYKGVVKSLGSKNYYEVYFDDGTSCNKLPENEIVGHDDDEELDPGLIVQVKWLGGPQLYTARIIARITSFTYEVKFENGSSLNVRWEDVYSAREELPQRVKERLSSATDMTNLSYWDDRVPDDCAKRPRHRASRFVFS